MPPPLPLPASTALRRRPRTGAGPPPLRLVARAGAALAVVALVLFAVVAVAVVRSGGHDRWDVMARSALLRPDGRAAAGVAGATLDLAAPAVVAVVTVVVAVALWRGARRPLLGAGVLAVAVATTALVQLLALALPGVRPSSTVLLGLPLFGSTFPSVRTAASVALWGALALTGVLLVRRPGSRALCVGAGLVLTGLLAWGELHRAHVWPTDVLGGWLLGAAAVGVAATLLATWPALPPAAPGPDAGHGVGAGGTTLGR